MIVEVNGGPMNQPIKNETRKLIVFICLAVFCVGPFVLLSAQPGDKSQKDEEFKRKRHLFFLTGNNLFDGRMLLKMKDKIGLTEKQEERIENLILGHEAVSIRNSGEIKIKELQFAAYLKTGKTDRKEMEMYIREISKEKTNLIVHYMNYLLDVRDVLTPQQLETLKQMKEQEKNAIRQREKQKNKKKGVDSPTFSDW
jgi:Spy/CpxP family protein refolding chaperone